MCPFPFCHFAISPFRHFPYHLSRPFALRDRTLATTIKAGSPGGRLEQSLHPTHFDLRSRWRRRAVFIQLPRISFGDVTLGESMNNHGLSAATRTIDDQFVADAQIAVRFGNRTIHADPADFARSLRLGSRFEQASDVEPDVEANCIGHPCKLPRG